MRQVPRPEDYRNQSNDPRSWHPFSEPHTLRKGNLETKQSTRTVGNFVQQQRGFSFFFFNIYGPFVLSMSTTENEKKPMSVALCSLSSSI